MKIINAQACAGLSHLPDGEWTLHSRFSQAINYCRPDGTLLTLFRFGKGMGPAGVLLTTRHFAACSHLTRLIKQGNLLWGADILIRPRRVLSLTPKVAELRQNNVHVSPHLSGLCGALNQPLAAMPIFDRFTQELEHWLKGETPDWSWLIGCGPGLTPAGDDMLIGALAVLYATGHTSSPRPFLPPADQLAHLTTSVSCRYLNSARHGTFSTPVLRLLRRWQSTRSAQYAVQRLLNVGHTSGADTLLGMAIAQQVLRQWESRRVHARSGNNTHVYSGC